MTLEEIDRVAYDKGILVIGAGDFTHPAWFNEIKEKLEPAEPGNAFYTHSGNFRNLFPSFGHARRK